MDMQKAQLLDKNRCGHMATEAVCAAELFITLLGFINGITMWPLVRAITCIVCMIGSAVAFRVIRYEYKFRHVSGVLLILLYNVTLFTSENNQMYALCYAIAIVVMLYADKMMVTIGAGTAVGALLISEFVRVPKGLISPTDAVIQVLFTSVACFLAVCVVRIQYLHAEANIASIQEGADAQTATSGKIVELATQLNEKFEIAQGVSAELNETMDTTHASVAEIAESSKSTAEAVEQQTAQTTDIQEGIHLVGEQARNMGEISDRTSTAVDEGVRLIEQLKSQASEVAKINIETRATTEALNDSIKDVQAITETILGISSQTNLLALNASIEAARAGEAGKGFAVVADEIRTLSENTREATEQISNIIERLTKDAQTAADSMSQSANYAQKQNELIEETGEKLTDIKNETDELHEGVIQVNGSVDNIIAANTLIMDSISNLSAQSEEVASTTESVLAMSDSSMDALGNMNEILKEISNISREMEDVAK